jgi:hypothetical protein
MGGEAEPIVKFSDEEHRSGGIGVRQYLPDRKTGSVRFGHFSVAVL